MERLVKRNTTVEAPNPYQETSQDEDNEKKHKKRKRSPDKGFGKDQRKKERKPRR